MIEDNLFDLPDLFPDSSNSNNNARLRSIQNDLEDPEGRLRKFRYRPGSADQANQRYKYGSWPTRGRSGETTREAHKVARLRVDHEKMIEEDDSLTEEEKEMRIDNWQKLVFEVTFGGDRSRTRVKQTGDGYRGRNFQG